MLKKFLITLSIIVLSANLAFCASANSTLIRSGIAKYKAKNYAGCIYTMKDVIKNDPSNAMAHYYTAISYARLGDKAEAINYYTKVVNLNSNATLTSYAKQGLEAINNGYVYNTQNAQADKFVQGNYKSGVNPDITKQLKLMDLERTKEDINQKVHAPKITVPSDEEKAAAKDNKDKDKNKDKNKDNNKKDKETKTEPEKTSYNAQPTDAEIAQAVRTLAAIGVNPLQMGGANAQMMQYQQNPQMAEQMAASSQAANDLAQLQMMFGSQNNNNNFGYGNNNMMNFLPYLMQNGNNGAMSKEMLQTMMMTQMMPDFSFDTSKK